ncbi:fluoride efflux transporter CrcB [Sphingomonas mucosissima]|uniref:Fluoride-specific ion channel FluC n=1 Tax=Sphingomonas mucosissima TaxID=370959 RepID=A0A245ZST9_9SPHN|nr:fluoride efflux transporter CrcB [Sphingomonas mucosissima]OWK32823.1 putative fluoride ion transporter CrcB [Sphingomonas mucosissima]
MNALFLVMAGGAIGAGLRHLVGRATLSAFGAAWPWGTLFVNIAGGFAMGLLAASVARVANGETWRLFLAVGVLGGFTTFSAFSFDAVVMMERGAWVQMLAYVLISVIGSIAALAVGFGLARSAA